MDRFRPAHPRRPHVRRDRRELRPRPRRRPASSAAPARASCSPCATPRAARRRRAASPATAEVRELDLASLASVRAFADAWDGAARRADQQRRRDGRAPSAHRRRLRDAARHQPPRPLRADQPAARPRSATASSRSPRGAHRIGKIDLDDLNWERSATSAGPPTARPSSPTCSSRSSSSAAWRRPARRCARSPRTPATRRPSCRSARGNAVQNALMVVGNIVLAQIRRDGRAADALRRHAGHPRRQLRRPRRLPGAARAPELVGRCGRAKDADVARRLWEQSEELTGISFPLAGAARLEERLAARQHGAAQLRRRPVALLAVVVPQPLEHAEHVVEADRRRPMRAARADSSGRAASRCRCRRPSRRPRRARTPPR